MGKCRLLPVTKIGVHLDSSPARIAVFSPEATGSIYITGDRTSTKGPLLNVGSCINAANLGRWSVYLNGEQINRKLEFSGGMLRLRPKGICLNMR